jgi:hypothetical protein
LAGVLLRACLLVSSGTNDTAKLGVRLLWLISSGAALVTAVIAVFSPNPILNVALASACLIVSFGFWRLYRRIFNHGEVDLVGYGMGARVRGGGTRDSAA